MAKAKTYSSSSGNNSSSNSNSNSNSSVGRAAAASSANNSNRGGGGGGRDQDEQHGLLSGSNDNISDGDDGRSSSENGFLVHPGDSDGSASPDLDGSSHPPHAHNHNHNHNHKPGGRIPSNTRVRFDLRPTNIPPPANGNSSNNNSQHDLRHDNGDREHGEGDDYRRASRDDFEDFDIDDADMFYDDPARTARRPLLTDIEAPSIAVANNDDIWGDNDTALLDPEAEAARSERARPRSGMRPAFMNMANSIIGAGIIGQPYAMRQAGLLSGTILLLTLTVVVDWTIRLIVVNSKLSGAGSFQGTVERCFGKPGLIAISLAQWLFAFGGMVAFGVIVGDSIPPVLRAIWPGIEEADAGSVVRVLTGRRAVIVVCTLGVSYPLTLYRDISKLAKASTLALISMGVILITVLIQGLLVPAEARGSFSTPLLTVNGGIFQAIGVISFAFVCHHNSLLIYGSLKTPTMDRFATVTHYSVGVSTVACLAMGLAGFLTFGDRTLGNVLNNFPAGNTMVTIARLCFGLNMLTTLPLEAFVCREVMLNYYFPGEPFSMNLHLILSSALVVSAMAVSLITCDVGAVFDLVGATSACALAYVLPPLCFIRLSSARSWRTYAAWAVVAFGCAVMAISVLQASMKMITGGDDPVQCVY